MRSHDSAPTSRRQVATASMAAGAHTMGQPTAAHVIDHSPRMAAQQQQLGAAFGPVVQRVRIRQSGSGKYKLAGNHPQAPGDIETDRLSAGGIRLLLRQNLAGPVKEALLERLLEINDEGQQELRDKDDTIARLNDDNNDLKGRISTATAYLKEDGEALSRGGVFRELVIPVTTGSLALVNGPINAFLNTATRVDMSLITAGVATALQVVNDGTLIWSAQNNWRRGYLVTAMVCQMASQMLMAVPGTDDPMFQAPPQNDTLASNATAVPFTGSYEGNKWVFVSIAVILGLLAAFFRLLDSCLSNSQRREKSKERVDEVNAVNPQARRDDSDGSDGEGGSRMKEVV